MAEYHDRAEAGRALAGRLAAYRTADPVVVALPRGGVPVAAEVARALGAPLNLSIPRKVGHPQAPEYAVAAVTETGEPVTNETEVARLDPDWFAGAVSRERAEAARRRQRYLAGYTPVAPTGRTVILVDDGIATGLTMRAALADVRNRGATKVIVAVPVAPADTAHALRAEADEVIVAHQPSRFAGSIGAYYEDFPQLSDEEVVALVRAGG